MKITHVIWRDQHDEDLFHIGMRFRYSTTDVAVNHIASLAGADISILFGNDFLSPLAPGDIADIEITARFLESDNG